MKTKNLSYAILLFMLCLNTQARASLSNAPNPLPGQLQPGGGLEQNSSLAFTVQDTVKPQDCATEGDQTSGTSLCKQMHGDGSYLMSESTYEKAWNELKNQTILMPFDAFGKAGEKQVVRQRTRFSDESQTIRTQDSFDIVSYPAGQKITREVLIFEYWPDGKTFSKVSYAKYNQIDDLAFAGLIYNVALHYDDEGLPLKGRAELWKDGKKSHDFFRWNREVQGPEMFDPIAWKQWEDLAKASSLQRILA